MSNLRGSDLVGHLGQGLAHPLSKGLVEHGGHIDLGDAVLDGLDLALLFHARRAMQHERDIGNGSVNGFDALDVQLSLGLFHGVHRADGHSQRVAVVRVTKSSA